MENLRTKLWGGVYKPLENDGSSHGKADLGFSELPLGSSEDSLKPWKVNKDPISVSASFFLFL